MLGCPLNQNHHKVDENRLLYVVDVIVSPHILDRDENCTDNNLALQLKMGEKIFLSIMCNLMWSSCRYQNFRIRIVIILHNKQELNLDCISTLFVIIPVITGKSIQISIGAAYFSN